MNYLPHSIYTSACVEALYHAQQHYIEIFYKGEFTKSEDFRKAVMFTGNYAVQHRVKRWFIDQRNMNIHPTDHVWFFKEWQPDYEQRIGKGRKTAIIPAKNLFSEFSIKAENQKLMKLSGGAMEVRYFLQKDEALAWLLANNEKN